MNAITRRYETTAYCADCDRTEVVDLRAGRSAVVVPHRLRDARYRRQLLEHAAARCTRCGGTAIDDRRMTTTVKGEETPC